MKFKEKYNFLFLCTGNSEPCIIAESLLNRIGNGKFFAYSAGNNSTGKIHPCTNNLLKTLNVDTSELRSKNWGVFVSQRPPQRDCVVAVCDNAAGKACPIWLGAPIKLHWFLPDPAGFIGSGKKILEVFRSVYVLIEKGAQIIANVARHKFDKMVLEKKLNQFVKTHSNFSGTQEND